MIVSASRRTDIPALYMDWFIKRLEEKYAAVANPYNANQVRRVSLARADVDAFVFWSKNPAPFYERADALDGYPWLLHFTLNDYPRAIEPGMPPLDARLALFRQIALRFGSSRVNWRYDPILLAEGIDPKDHAAAFERVASALEGHTETCTISFIDEYTGMEKRMRGVGYRKIAEAELFDLAGALARVGEKHGIRLSACAEPYDLSVVGIEPGRCIDAERLSGIAGRPIAAKPDRNQRPGCHCAASVDIGRYGTCAQNCIYCYAVKGTARLSSADGDML